MLNFCKYKYFNVNFNENIAYNSGVIYNLVKKEDDTMSMALLDFTERLVPISDFSQWKAGKIFNDVAENNNEYIVKLDNKKIYSFTGDENEYNTINNLIKTIGEHLKAQIEIKKAWNKNIQ